MKTKRPWREERPKAATVVEVSWFDLGLLGSVLRSQCYVYRIYSHKVRSTFVCKLVFSTFVLLPTHFLIVLVIVDSSPVGRPAEINWFISGAASCRGCSVISSSLRLPIAAGEEGEEVEIKVQMRIWLLSQKSNDSGPLKLNVF